MERKSDVNTELRKFLLFNCKYARDESNPKIFEYAGTAMNILRALPTCRFAVLDYFINVFEEATIVLVKVDPSAKQTSSTSESQGAAQILDACNATLDDFARCIQELLDHNPIAWTDVLFNWSIETFVRCFDAASRARQSVQQAGGGTPLVNKSASIGTIRSVRAVLDLLITALRCAEERLRDAELFERALERLFSLAGANATAFDALVTHVGSQFGDQLVDRAMLLTLKDFEWPPTDAGTGRTADTRRFASLFAILSGDRQASTIRRLVRALLFGTQEAAGGALSEFVQHRLSVPFVAHLAALNDAVCAAFSEQLHAALNETNGLQLASESLRVRFAAWRPSLRETDTLYAAAVHFLVRSVALTDRFDLLRLLLNKVASKEKDTELQRVANRCLLDLCLSLERARESSLVRVGENWSETRGRPSRSRQDTYSKAVQVMLRATGESQFLLELLSLLMDEAEAFYGQGGDWQRRQFAYAMLLVLNTVANGGRTRDDTHRLAAVTLRYVLTHSNRCQESHWRLFVHLHCELRTRSDGAHLSDQHSLLRQALCAGVVGDAELSTLERVSERSLDNLLGLGNFLLTHQRAVDDAGLVHSVAHCARCVLLRVASGRTSVPRVCDALELFCRALTIYIGSCCNRPVRLHLFDASELHRLVETLTSVARRALASERRTQLLSRVSTALGLLNTISRTHLQPTLVHTLLNNVYFSNRSLFDDTTCQTGAKFHGSVDLAPPVAADDMALDYSIIQAFRQSNERSTEFEKLRKRTFEGNLKEEKLDSAVRLGNRTWLVESLAAIADDERGVELLGTLLCEAVLGDRVCLFASSPGVALGWTDECLVASSKYTLESDLEVRRQLDAETIRALLEFLSRRRLALLTVLPLVHAGLNVLVTIFESTALQNVEEMRSEVQLAEFLLEALTRNGLLSPPLVRCLELLHCVTPCDVGTILRAVRDYLRDKRRALFEARLRSAAQSTSMIEQLDTSKYKDVLQTVVHAHIDRLGHLFHHYI